MISPARLASFRSSLLSSSKFQLLSSSSKIGASKFSKFFYLLINAGTHQKLLGVVIVARIVAADFWRARFQTNILKILRFLALLITYEFINSRVEASFVFFVVILRVFAFSFAKRVFWTIDAAGRTLGAAGTGNVAV